MCKREATTTSSRFLKQGGREKTARQAGRAWHEWVKEYFLSNLHILTRSTQF